MGDCVDREVAMSQRDKEIETEATRQTHYIRWAQIMKVPDPCGHQQGYQRIVAIYIKYLMTGVNFGNKDFLRLATVQGYASSINLLFKLRDIKPPIDVADPNNASGILITTLSRKRISQDSAVHWIVPSLPNCFVSRMYLAPWTQNSALCSILSF